MSDNGMQEVMEEALAEVQGDNAQEEQYTETQHTDPYADADDFEVASPLDNPYAAQNAEDSEEAEQEIVAPTTGESRTLRYPADGQEHEATEEEAIKALSMMKGARRAFSDRAKLKRRVKELESRSGEGDEYKQKWLEVMKDGASPEQVWERLTGQSFAEAIQRAQERADIYARATDEERKILDYEDKFKSYDQQMRKFQEENNRLKTTSEEKEFNAEVKYLQSMAEPAFFEVTSQLENEKLQKMIWRSSIADLKDLKKEGRDPSPRLVKKIFQENAAAVIGTHQAKVDEKLKEVVAQKKETATAKAQDAASRNYNTDSRDMDKMNPLDLFNKFIRK